MSDDAPDIVAPNQPISRSFALDDLVVRSEGDGRTVEAYAAVFGQATEIRDHEGHYFESISRSAFDVTLKRGSKVSVLFNHGLDIYGNPSDRFSLPIGTPDSIKTDGRGLRTVTRIAKTDLGDEVLELMRAGAIDGFSFTGKPLRSQRVAPSKGDDLPTIVRQELALKEYGPAVFRAYEGAKVLALRAETLAEHIDQLPPDQLVELVEVLRSRVPDLAEGRSGDSSDADDTASRDRLSFVLNVDGQAAVDGLKRIGDVAAAGDFERQRRLMAARLRGLINE